MAVVITSTTSPQEHLDHAVSEEWRQPQPEKEEVKDDTETVETEEVKKEEEAGEKPAPKGHKGGGILKRVDKLTAINARLEKENEELRAKVKPPDTKAPEGPREPKLADFGNDVEKYVAARDAWKQAEEVRLGEAERQKETFEGYNKKVSEARGAYDDWDEVVSAADAIKIPQSAYLAVVESENGPDVAYYLAQHPEEAQTLVEMSPIGAVRAIAKISDKLLASKSTPKPKDKPKPPEPLATVGGSATRSNVSLDQLPVREYIKIRNKQERENRQR
jgi:hypothetical protein